MRVRVREHYLEAARDEGQRTEDRGQRTEGSRATNKTIAGDRIGSGETSTRRRRKEAEDKARHGRLVVSRLLCLRRARR